MAAIGYFIVIENGSVNIGNDKEVSPYKKFCS